MAKPIPRTPTLNGKAADEFLLRMLREEKHPDPKRIAFIKEAEKAMKKIKIIY